MGSEAEKKFQKRRVKCIIFLCLSIVTMIIVLSLGTTLSMWKSNDINFAFVSSGKKSESESLLAKLSQSTCTISFQPSSKEKETWTTKPIWLPGYSTSFQENIHNDIINRMTGLDSGAKSFYASRKGALRQCYGTTETATCSNIHPIVKMNGGPEKNSVKFFPGYIMAIRNPITAIPAFHNEKQIKYHNGKGQVAEKVWQETRDKFLPIMIEEWKSVLKAWKESTHYKVGMYLVYEDLMNERKGSDVLNTLRALFDSAGFSVAPKEDLTCIWYNAIGKERLEQYQKQPYEYDDYIPGYTKKQQDLLSVEISVLIEEYKDDNELLSILTRYKDTIQHNIRIE